MGCSSLARRLLVPIVASGPFAVAALSADELPIARGLDKPMGGVVLKDTSRQSLSYISM